MVEVSATRRHCVWFDRRFSSTATRVVSAVSNDVSRLASGATATPAAVTGPSITSPPLATALAGGVKCKTVPLPLVGCSEKYVGAGASPRKNGE